MHEDGSIIAPVKKVPAPKFIPFHEFAELNYTGDFGKTGTDIETM
jgi:hypothetical protein